MTTVLIYSTWPNARSAQDCALQLIEQRMAACVTILPVAHSFFRWEGKVEQSEEAVMLAKTIQAQAGAARDAILTAHPYDLPCVLALNVETASSNPEFLQWIATETMRREGGAANKS